MIMTAAHTIQALKQGAKASEGKTLEEAKSRSARKGIRMAKEGLQKFMDALDEADQEIEGGADPNKAMDSAFQKNMLGEFDEDPGDEADDAVDELDEDIAGFFDDLENPNKDDDDEPDL